MSSRGKLVVLGYNENSKTAREMNIASKCGKDVIELNNIAGEANMVFDRAEIRYHEDGKLKGRPYLHLYEGSITSLSGDFPYNVNRIRFTESGAPKVDVDWEFSNDELSKLIPKGIMGSDWDVNPNGPYGKPKAPFEVPSIFTEVEFEGLPVTVETVQAMRTEDGIPVISVKVANAFDVKQYSGEGPGLSGYTELDAYFAAQPTYPVGQTDKSSKFVSAEMSLGNEDIIGYAETKDADKEAADNVVKAPVYLSPEEQAEAIKRAELQKEVSERITVAEDEAQVDKIVEAGEDVEIPVESDDKTDYIEPDDSEAFDEEMLKDMHLVPDEQEEADKRAAAKKIAEMQTAKYNQQMQINDAMQEGNRVINRENENMDNKSTPSIQ